LVLTRVLTHGPSAAVSGRHAAACAVTARHRQGGDGSEGWGFESLPARWSSRSMRPPRSLLDVLVVRGVPHVLLVLAVGPQDENHRADDEDGADHDQPIDERHPGLLAPSRLHAMTAGWTLGVVEMTRR
jgi:hypothetical protein